MLLVRICWGPARGRFAGSGGFGFRILDFEFVWDFDIGISDFPFWLRPQAALGIRRTEILMIKTGKDGTSNSIPGDGNLLVAHDYGFVGGGGLNFGISDLFEISNLGFRISS